MSSQIVHPKINLENAFAQIKEHWQPHIAAELNGQHVKLAKLLGQFEMHHHVDEDEMFLVHRGSLDMQMNDRTITISAGEFFVVPKGVDHKPIAREEVEVILFEPAGTLNTGNLENERTVRQPTVLKPNR